MIRRHATALHALLMLADASLALLVLLVVSVVRFGDTWTAGLQNQTDPIWAFVTVYAFGWVLLLYLEGEYRLRAQWSLRTEIVGITRAALWMALASFTALYLTKATDASRLFLLVLFPVLAISTIAMRAGLRWYFRRYREQGHNVRNMLVLGTGKRAIDFASQIESHAALGLRVIGFLGDDPSAVPEKWLYLGPVDSLESVLHNQVVDEVAVCMSLSDLSLVESIAQLCSEEGKIVRIPLEVPQFETARRFVEDLDGTAVLSLVRGPDRVLALAVKRVVDIVISAVGLVLLFPLFIAVGAYVRIKDGAPVLYRQTRVGINGRPFTLLKFRTMVRGADTQLTELMAQNEMLGHVFKITDDPRIAPWGRGLRKFSIDELPQLWNVLKGEMSLVGPRPPLPWEVADYDLWHRRKLSMKPGITGLQQVEARRDPQFDRWVTLDLKYIDQWSLWLDVKIALKTLPALIRSEGR